MVFCLMLMETQERVKEKQDQSHEHVHALIVRLQKMMLRDLVTKEALMRECHLFQKSVERSFFELGYKKKQPDWRVCELTGHVTCKK